MSHLYMTIGPQPPRCCTENTAECLSCQTGQTLDEYCRVYPRMIGCPGMKGVLTIIPLTFFIYQFFEIVKLPFISQYYYFRHPTSDSSSSNRSIDIDSSATGYKHRFRQQRTIIMLHILHSSRKITI